jgi:radical SAM superfamily enzyme YgiQ (UPF0313 family)
MKLLLIMPYPRKRNSSFFSRFFSPCLSLQQIAAIVPEEFDVELVDERLEKPCYEDEYDLVGISCMTYNSFKAYRLADEFRSRGIKVVLGGYHPTVMPEEAKQHADSVVIGEAENTWPQLLKDFNEDKLKSFYRSNEFVNPKLIPAAVHNIQKYKNQKVESIQASRGCPVECKFCAMQNIEGINFRGRPIDNIIKELDDIDKKNIYFADASLTINPIFSKNLFKEMKPLHKHFSGMGNINVSLKDDEFLKLAREAGCGLWLIGFESFSQNTINSMGKKANKIEEYKKVIEKFHDYGIRVIGSFIFGFDTDTGDVFQKTYESFTEIDIDIPRFNILTPLPGTYIFKQFEQEKRLLTYDWSKYTDDGGEVVFQPKNMTTQELLEGVDYIYNKFDSFSGNIKRFFKHKNIDLFSIFRMIEKYF